MKGCSTGGISGQCNKFFILSRCPDCFWDLNCRLYNRCESFFSCESSGRSKNKVDTRFRQGTLSEIGLRWKYIDQLGFTYISLQFKENSRTVTAIEFNGGTVFTKFLLPNGWRRRWWIIIIIIIEWLENKFNKLLLLLNGWRISFMNYYYWMSGE